MRNRTLELTKPTPSNLVYTKMNIEKDNHLLGLPNRHPKRIVAKELVYEYSENG
jgi:hypothetical protein